MVEKCTGGTLVPCPVDSTIQLLPDVTDDDVQSGVLFSFRVTGNIKGMSTVVTFRTGPGSGSWVSHHSFLVLSWVNI